MTERAFLFVPAWLERLMGTEQFRISREEIRQVRIEPAGTPIARKRGLSAWVRPQVEIHHVNGLTAMAVRNPQALVDALTPSPR